MWDGGGELCYVPKDVLDTIHAFTCQLYAKNANTVCVNSLLYHIFCTKKGQIESGQLPPCEDSLRQHTVRANYLPTRWLSGYSAIKT